MTVQELVDAISQCLLDKTLDPSNEVVLVDEHGDSFHITEWNIYHDLDINLGLHKGKPFADLEYESPTTIESELMQINLIKDWFKRRDDDSHL